MGALVGWIVLGLGGIVLLLISAASWKPLEGDKRSYDYAEQEAARKSIKWGTFFGALTCFVLVALWIVFRSIVVVSPTSAAVIKNTYNGTMRYAGPGWQVLNPVLEQAAIYDLRIREFQIGEPNVKDPDGTVKEVKAIEADSNSPGRPVVYMCVTSRVGYSTEGCPGPDCALIEIERKYGKEGWENLVKDRMEMIPREIAGKNPYNFVGDEREKFAAQAYESLQEELSGLATMEYVGIPWYDFSQEINQGLARVAEQERQNEQKAQEVERERLETQRILEVKSREVQEATQNAERARIEKEGQRVASLIEAEAAADVVKVQVDMEAYETETRAAARANEILAHAEAQAQADLLLAKARADGFRAQLSAFGGDVDGFVAWTQAIQWQGGVPQTVMGDAPIPIWEMGE